MHQNLDCGFLVVYDCGSVVGFRGGGGMTFCSLDSMACRIRGTRFGSLLMVSVIGQSASACQIGSMLDGVTALVVADATSWGICSTFAALALVTHSWAAFRISSFRISSWAVFAFLRVVTCCTSVVLTVSGETPSMSPQAIGIKGTCYMKASFIPGRS